jgi:hypothetical protein
MRRVRGMGSFTPSLALVVTAVAAPSGGTRRRPDASAADGSNVRRATT